jgi:hypothetical protein
MLRLAGYVQMTGAFTCTHRVRCDHTHSVLFCGFVSMCVCVCVLCVRVCVCVCVCVYICRIL